jgi:molybdenum cofactor cytidylyltransferase
MKINGLILAAGDSSRLGQAKQLVTYQGESLLADIEAKLLTCCDHVFVVLGHQAELFSKELKSAEVIINPHWQSGIGSSLACGVHFTGEQSDGLLMALSDQPLIQVEHYQKLAKQFALYPNHIIATKYNSQIGVPALFPKIYFNELTQLNENSGAQAIIKKHHKHVTSIECQAAGYDVDTPEDLFKLDNSSVG